MNHRLAIPAVLAVLAAGEQALGQVMRQKISGSGLQQTDQFGISVAISGDWAVVGANGADDLAPTSGAAYVYSRTTSGWVEQQRLKAGDPTNGAQFGASVAIDGITMAIGTPYADYQGIQDVLSPHGIETAVEYRDRHQPEQHPVGDDSAVIHVAYSSLPALRGAPAVPLASGLTRHGWPPLVDGREAAAGALRRHALPPARPPLAAESRGKRGVLHAVDHVTQLVVGV